MNLFKVSNFFCCGSLRAGGFIIGYASLAIDIICIVLGLHWFGFLPDLLVTIPMLYGIHKNHPGWMTPAIVLSILSVIIFTLHTFVGMPLLGFVFWRETREYVIYYAREWFHYHVYNIQELFFASWAIIAVVSAFQWYFTSVLYSLQKSIQSERKTNARYNLAVGEI